MFLKPVRLPLPLLLIAALCAASVGAPAHAGTSPPSQAVRGDQAHGDLPGPGASGVFAIRTPQQWQKFQRDARMDWAVEIDFNRDMVIAVLLGTRNTGGYRVEIAEIRTETWHTEVTYREIPPPATAPVIQTLTNPYVIAIIAQTPSPVAFSKGFFKTLRIPYEEFTRLIRTISEMNYQLEDERRQKVLAESRVHDLMDLIARTGVTPEQ